LKTTTLIIFAICMTLAGCQFSPFSPSNRPNIRNNGGEIGDIKNNQQGLMAEILSLKNRLDLVARDVENLQNGIFNNNNRNFGVQIFHGEGGLAAGVVIVLALALMATGYRFKAERYKKTAEIFGEKIKKIGDREVEDEIFVEALAKKVEADVYKILKS